MSIDNGVAGWAVIIFGMITGLALYSSILESSKYQSTIGKSEYNCVVTDLEGKRISFKTATLRAILKVVSIGFFGIGLVMIYHSDKCQGLHDVYAKTIVVRNRNFSRYSLRRDL